MLRIQLGFGSKVDKGDLLQFQSGVLSFEDCKQSIANFIVTPISFPEVLDPPLVAIIGPNEAVQPCADQ
jgi:hypothetical protein